MDADPNQEGNQPEATDYVYDLMGNLQQTRLPNKVVSDYTYDELNRLTRLREFKDGQDSEQQYVYEDGVDTLLAQYVYDLAPDGKRTGVTEKTRVDSVLQETRIDWLYDDLGRLTRESYNSASDDSLDFIADHAFDLAGNRLTKKTDTNPTFSGDPTYDEQVTYEYDANDRLLTEAKDVGGTANTADDRFTRYEYGPGATISPSFGGNGTQQTKKTVRQGLDDSGSVVEEDTYTHNLQSRMGQVDVDSDGNGDLEERYEYTYDASGIRVTQTVTTDSDNDGSLTDETPVETKYLNDGQNPTGYSQVLEEKVSGNVTKSYTLGLDVIAQQAPAIANSGNLFLLYDGHGSTRGLVDATGQPLSGQVFRYDAFGNRLDNNTALTSLLYSGEQTDGTGLQYLRARYYDPSSGRFNRLDPFAGDVNDPQSLHKYLYCHGDGIDRVDPTGGFSVASVALGAGFGGIFGAIASGGLNYYQHRSWDLAGKAALRGFVLGAIGGAVFPVAGAGIMGGAGWLGLSKATGMALAFWGATAASGAVPGYIGAIWDGADPFSTAAAYGAAEGAALSLITAGVFKFSLQGVRPGYRHFVPKNVSETQAMDAVMDRAMQMARLPAVQRANGVEMNAQAKQAFFDLLQKEITPALANEGGAAAGVLNVRQADGTVKTVLSLALPKNAGDYTIVHELCHIARQAASKTFKDFDLFLFEANTLKFDPKYWAVFLREEAAAHIASVKLWISGAIP